MFAIPFNILIKKNVKNNDEKEKITTAVIFPDVIPNDTKHDTTREKNEMIAHVLVVLDKGTPIVRAHVSASFCTLEISLNTEAL